VRVGVGNLGYNRGRRVGEGRRTGNCMLLKANWEEAQERYRLWWAGEETDRPLLHVTAPRPGAAGAEFGEWEFARNPDDAEATIERFVRWAQGTYFGGEAYPNLWPNLGPGILAAYLGARARFESETVWFETPREWDEMGELRVEAENQWWQRTQRITQAAVDLCEGRYVVAMTDLGGVLDVLASLRGTENLCRDLVEAPERVDWARGRIMEAWHDCYDELQGRIETKQSGSSSALAIWCPERWYLLSCDFSVMISPEMFERFVAPDIERSARLLGHSLYHLDSPAQIRHLDILLEIEALGGIQWVPGEGNAPPDSPEWMPLYKRVQASGKRLVVQGVRAKNLVAMVEALQARGLLLAAGCRTPEEAETLIGEVARAARGRRR